MNRNAASLIPNAAQANRSRFAKKYRVLLNQQVKEVGQALRDGADITSVAAELSKKHQVERENFKLPWAIKYATEGWKLGGLVLGKKSFIALYRGKAAQEAAVISAIENFGADALVANQVGTEVGLWVETTSTLETRVTAKRYEKLVEQAAVFLDKKGRGITPRALAVAFESQGLADTQVRSNLMARTLTNWSYNEGAISLYESEGIGGSEWVATIDDVTGEWDAELNGKIIGLRQPFVQSGDVFVGSGGNIVEAAFDVPHPPLHPNCRCTLVPVVQ